MDETATSSATSAGAVTLGDYVKTTLILVACAAWLLTIMAGAHSPQLAKDALIAPIIALVGLTGVVCALMAAFRNLGILRGLTSPCDYIANQPQHGVDWIERPARTFNNLLQMPTLFYLVCVLMMLTHRVDQSSLTLAWTFVALRAVHAVIYIGWNTLHYRFGTWFAGCIVLATLWVRFAMLR